MATSESQLYALVLGRVVGHLREQRQWSQAQLAAAAGMTQPTLSRIERGQVLPDAFTLRQLAGAFGMTSAELTQRVEQALGQTEQVARSTAPAGPQKNASKTPWWQVAVAAAGAAGLAGLVAFAVASALEPGKKKPGGAAPPPGRPPPPRTPPRR